MLGNSRQRSGTNLLTIIECKCIVRMVFMLKSLLKSSLALFSQSLRLQGCLYLPCFERGPFANSGCGSEDWILIGSDSPFSSRSATTRRAKSSTFAIAYVDEPPQARTPVNSGISAIQRPSISVSHSNVKFLSTSGLMRL